MTLNSIDSDPDSIIVSLASDVITLNAGTYQIDGEGVLSQVTFAKTRFRNTTDSTTTLLGLSQLCDPTSNRTTTLRIMGRFTITAQKAFEWQYRCSTSEASDGLGRASNLGENETYRLLRIVKIA